MAPRLASHFFLTYASALVSAAFGDSPERASLAAIWRAFRQLPGAIRSRWSARDLARVEDTEAFLRPLGGYFRDRFDEMQPRPERLRVLFVSPYPVSPPVHGGGVFMSQTLEALARLCELHLIVLLHYPNELAAHEPLRERFASTEFLVKVNGRPSSAASVLPHAVREFAIDDLSWLIHRQIYTQAIDVVQLEYTPMGQYAGDFRRLVCALFEHDIYFQSVARGWSYLPGLGDKLKAGVEYLRALRWETRMLRRLDRVQACTNENLRCLVSYAPGIAGRIQAGLRAGIDTSRYGGGSDSREPFTMLFVGSFRHLPNQAALAWFTGEVLPAVRARRPEARLVVVGSDPPPPHAFPTLDHIELHGFAVDIREVLNRYAVFVCPVLSGSGVRVKLLEAFASGIPVVSTRLGAEGLASSDGDICALADEPREFADKILALFDDPGAAAAMAARARTEVERNWDITRLTLRLMESYRDAVSEKREAKSASRDL